MHMMLQLEDCTDCLKDLFPDHDFFFSLIEKEGDLNSEQMNKVLVAINHRWMKQKYMMQKDSLVLTFILGSYGKELLRVWFLDQLTAFHIR